MVGQKGKILKTFPVLKGFIIMRFVDLVVVFTDISKMTFKYSIFYQSLLLNCVYGYN